MLLLCFDRLFDFCHRNWPIYGLPRHKIKAPAQVLARNQKFAESKMGRPMCKPPSFSVFYHVVKPSTGNPSVRKLFRLENAEQTGGRFVLVEHFGRPVFAKHLNCRNVRKICPISISLSLFRTIRKENVNIGKNRQSLAKLRREKSRAGLGQENATERRGVCKSAKKMKGSRSPLREPFSSWLSETWKVNSCSETHSHLCNRPKRLIALRGNN